MRRTWAPKWGLSGLPSRIPDGNATWIQAGPLRAAQIERYMGSIWVPSGQLISVYNKNCCMYEYIQPFGKRELIRAMTLQLPTAVTMTVYQNPSMPLSRIELGTLVSKTIALTTNLR